MPQNLKKSKVSKTSKRHFTVVIKNKENGLYISSRPSLAAKKAVSKLCASNKNKKIEFHIREITRDSKKKTYGPYIGYLEQLDKSIKLKEYIIKYNPIVKLIKKSMVKKIVMRGGTKQIWKNYTGKYNSMMPNFIIETDEDLEKYESFSPSVLVYDRNSFRQSVPHYLQTLNSKYPTGLLKDRKKIIAFRFRNDITEDILQQFLERQRPKIIDIFQKLGIQNNVIIYLNIPYFNDEDEEPIPKYEKIEYLRYEPEVDSSAHNPNIIFSRINSINNQEKIVYLNIALKHIGIKKCLTLFGEFLRNFGDNLPIISVGSGMAYFEYLIQKVFRREVLCVDPDPIKFSPNRILSSNKKLFIRPVFNIVDNLLSSSNPNKYKDCLLILNWPNPGEEPYDLDAIIKLKPCGFFIIYEREGKAGSGMLIEKLCEREPIQFEEGLSYELLKKEESHEHKVLRGIIDVDLYYIVASYRRIEQ
jgi:hypothetical protein